MVTTRLQDASSTNLLESLTLPQPAESPSKRTRSSREELPTRKRRRVTDKDAATAEDVSASGSHPADERTLDNASEHSVPSKARDESAEAQLEQTGKAGRRRRERTGNSANTQNHTPASKDTKAAGESNSERALTSDTKLQSTHVRFDSEEPAMGEFDPPDVALAQSSPEEAAEQIEDSDDEAPEDVSASAAQKTTEAAAAGIAKAVQQQRLAEKRKRQERATRLKEQMQTSARRQKDSATQEEVTTEEAASPANDLSDDEDLPELLPDEVLAEEFTRLPTPPPVEKKQKDELLTQRKPIRLDAPPKDIKVGPVNVSVLEKFNRLLPPKASSGGKSLREAWLVGRRGKGGLAVERRRIGGAFVKR